MTRIYRLFGWLFAFCWLASCNSGEQPSTSMADEIQQDVDREEQASATLSEDIIDELIHAIPSPVEMTSLIRSSGADYNEDMLHESDQAEQYADNFHKALNLGVYGADLGYMNIYEKSGSTFGHLAVVKDLADDLKVGQFLDFGTLRRLASSNGDIDSLIYITTKGFSQMDAYLREQRRGNISVLIATGTWIEGMYIATQVADQTDVIELRDRIGEQKTTLDNIIHILEVYKDDPQFSELLTELHVLKSEYDNVTLSYTYSEPTAKEVDGVLVIEDNSTSTVEMSPDVMEKLIKKFAGIRHKIIG